MPSLNEFLEVARQDNPSLSDDALTSYWQKTYGGTTQSSVASLPTLERFMRTAREDNPNVPEEKLKSYWRDTYGLHGAEESEPWNVTRGLKNVFKQAPQVSYGLSALAAASLESLLGEGGIATAAKNWSLKGYEAWTRDIATTSRENDDVTVAWEKANEGDFGALVEWAAYGLGYATAQAGLILGTRGVGGVAGGIAGTAFRPAMEKLLRGMVEKQLAKTTGGKIFTDEMRKKAVGDVAAELGGYGALAATAFGMEGGEIGGDLVAKAAAEGRTLTGAEITRALGATFIAGGLEFASDVLGYTALTGKLTKGVGGAGMAGRATRAGVAGGATGIGEGLTEYQQTIVEEYGKGNEQSLLPWDVNDDTKRAAINAAALGALGGAAHGVVGGALFGRPRPLEAPKPDPAILGADTVDEAIAAAMDTGVRNPPARGIIESEVYNTLYGERESAAAYQQKAVQDAAVINAQEGVAEAQRAAQVAGTPTAPAALTAMEEEARAQRDTEIGVLSRLAYAAGRTANAQPIVERAGDGIIGQALARARLPGETQAAYRARLGGGNAVQEPSATSLPVRQAPGNREALVGGNAQGQEAAGAQVQRVNRAGGVQAPQVAAQTPTTFAAQPVGAAQAAAAGAVVPAPLPAPPVGAVAVPAAGGGEQSLTGAKPIPVANAVERLTKQTGVSVEAVGEREAPAFARATAAAVKKTFGKRVVFVRAGKAGYDAKGVAQWGFDGSVLEDDQSTVYVNLNSNRKWQAVIGHETTHALKRTNRRVYNELQNSVNVALKTGAFSAIAKKYSELDAEGRNEEVIANVVGDQMHDVGFWIEVFKNTKSVRALANALFAGIDKIISMNRLSYKTSQFVKDARVVRKAVAKAYADWEVNKKEGKKARDDVSVEDIHQLAEERGIAWDDNDNFMDFTEDVTGKRKLDDLTPYERELVHDALLSKPENKNVAKLAAALRADSDKIARVTRMAAAGDFDPASLYKALYQHEQQPETGAFDSQMEIAKRESEERIAGYEEEIRSTPADKRLRAKQIATAMDLNENLVYAALYNVKRSVSESADRRVVADDDYGRNVFLSKPENQRQAGITTEVAPNQDNAEIASAWGALPYESRVAITKKLGGTMVRDVARGMGITAPEVEYAVGGFDGEVNPTLIVKADVPYQRLMEFAQVLGYAASQKSVITYDESVTDGENIAQFVKVIPSRKLTVEEQESLFRSIQQSVAEASGFTGRDDAMVFGNFSGIADAKFRDRIAEAVVAFGGRVHFTTVSSRFRSDYIGEPVTLEGTRYGNRDAQETQAGRDDLRWRQWHPDSVRAEVERQLQEEIAAAETAEEVEAALLSKPDEAPKSFAYALGGGKIERKKAALVSKFKRQKLFNVALPKLAERIENDANAGKEEAIVLRLIMHTGFRNGGDRERGKVPAFGATTLRREHVSVVGDTIKFNFVGKAGMPQVHDLENADVASDIAARLRFKPNHGRLFTATTDTKVLAYLKSLDSRFIVHDFRTWNATDEARLVVNSLPVPRTQAEYNRQHRLAIESAANKIGDTFKTTEEAYVDKSIFEAWKQAVNESRDVDQRAGGRNEEALRQRPVQEERAILSKPDLANGESVEHPIETERAAVAHDRANPPQKDRLGKCHYLVFKKVADDGDFRQIIGVVNALPKGAPKELTNIKIWHSLIYDQKTRNVWEPIANRWYTLDAMKAFGFEPVVSLDLGEVTRIAMKTRMAVSQEQYSKNVKPLRNWKLDYLQPGDYDADWGVLSKPESKLDTKTPEFKKWFKGSKVVDTNSEPLVVYHGSGATDIEQFDGVAWFSEGANLAAAYSGAKAWPEGAAPTMYPAHLAIRNPLSLSINANDKITADQLRAKTGIAFAQGKYTSEAVDGVKQKFPAHRLINAPEFIDAAKAKGYDGLHIREGTISTWAAFKPEQIKSVFNKRPTNSPNVLLSKPDIEEKPVGTRIQWAVRPRNGSWISETGDGRYIIEPEKGGYWAYSEGELVGPWHKSRKDAIDALNDAYLEEISEGRVQSPEGERNVLKKYDGAAVKRLLSGLRKLAKAPDIFRLKTSNAKTLKDVVMEVDTERVVNHIVGESAGPGEIIYNIAFTNGKVAFVYESLVDNAAHIDIQHPEAGSQLGSFLYPAVFNWAKNNGLKIIVDPNNLSAINTYRRTEQMLSAALKFDDTAIMSPIRYVSPERVEAEGLVFSMGSPLDRTNPQGLFGWNENPKTKADHDKNLAIIALTSMENTFSKLPILERYKYNFEKRRFEDGGGQNVTSDDFEKLAGQDIARKWGIGRTTIARAVFMNSLLDNEEEAKPFLDGDIKPSEILGDGVPRTRSLALYSKPDYIGADPVANAAARKAGLWHPAQPFKQRVQEMLPTMYARMRQGIFDQFASIKNVSHLGYMLARMSKGTDGALEAAFLYGKPFLEDGALNVDIRDGGLTKILQRLGGEHDRFIAWIAGNRAAQLKTEGREHLFEDNEIDWLKSLNKGNMSDGRNRAVLYAEVHREFNAYSKAILDIAEKQGLIDPDSRSVWEKDFYVPFYRNMKDEISGPTVKSGLVSQQAFKRLKGGKEELNDLLANTLQNWAHLLSAAMKNKAALTTMEAAVKAGGAVEAPNEYVGKQMGIGKMLKALDNGIERYFIIEDPLLVDAISSLESFSFGLTGKIFEKFKRWLTIGVTANPSFKIRNMIRDSISAIGVSELGYNPLKNVSSAWADTAHSSQLRASLLASGGIIRFGTQIEGSREEYVRDLIDEGVPESQILNTRHKFLAMLELAWDHYQEFGDRGENVNRVALYKQLRAEGKNHLEASYAARDLMDFSMQGTWRSIRFLAQTVPFFNARLQGLYKGGRAAAENPRKLGYVIGAVALASTALMLAYKDDEDWKKREDWDRDNFWWFKVAGKAFRIPKPFEIGAVGTMAERMFEYALTKEMTGERLASRLTRIVLEQLAMYPMPQVARPLIELYANRDFFRGRPIETMGMENLSPKERIARSTSPTSQLLGKQNVLSPVQIDHLIRAYFGWLGTSATTLLDYGIRPAMGIAQRPEMKLRDVFIAGNFIESLPSSQSRYVSDFYESSVEIERAYADFRNAVLNRQPEKAESIRKEKAAEIGLHGMVSGTSKQLSALNKLERMIEVDKSMDPAEKRRRLDRLDAIKHGTAKRHAELLARRRESAVRQ